MSGELGKASLDLEANLEPFRRNVKAAKGDGDELQHSLDALAAVARVSERELNRVRMGAGQAAESQAVADRIERSAGRVGRAAMEATQHLQEVKISAANAAESDLAGDVIDRKLKDINSNAKETTRALERVKLAGGVPGRSGVGVGPFGSGFGRVGMLGAAVGTGVLATPAAGPATLGLLAAVPVLAGAGAGALGTLALAFDGVTKAISGDAKAFKELGPAAQQFTLTVRSLDGLFDKLRQTAASSLFPGLTAGLKAALSPGTLAAITQAITEFGHAIGQAGAAWGRYFGSAEFQQLFGPLMQQGARTLGQLSAAALSLFDSLGVLGRAAIPLTNWMTSGLAGAARLADEWLHARDASGQLAGAMNEAQVSLRLVGGLLASLIRAVGSLGSALYPVSKIAVKDLTDGLNALAGIIDRNKQTIREIVAGALAALVSTVKALAPLVKALAGNLNAVAHAVGGWKTAFQIVLSGFLASKLLGVAKSMGLIGAQASAAEGKALTLAGTLKSLSGMVVTTAIVLSIIPKSNLGQKELDKLGLGFLGRLPILGGMETQAAALGTKAGTALSNATGANDIPNEAGKLTAQAKALRDKALRAAGIDPSTYKQLSITGSTAGVTQSLLERVAAAAKAVGATGVVITSGARSAAHNAVVGGVANSNHLTGNAVDGYAIIGGKRVPLGQALLGVAGKYGLRSGDVAGFFNGQPDPVHVDTGANQGSPFGTPPPFTKNLGPKPPKPSVIPASVSHLQDLASANASQAKQLGNVGGTAKRYLENELADLAAADKQLDVAIAKAHGKAKTELQRTQTGIENKMRDVQTRINHALLTMGDALLPPALKARLTALTAKFKADSTFAQVLTGKAAEDFAATLKSDIFGQESVLTSEVAVLKRKLAGATGKQKTAIQKELAKVEGQLSNVQQQVVQTLQGTVQTLQQHVSSYMSNVQSELDFQFEQATQAMLDQTAKDYFQNGLLTPLEQQLRDMQAADQLKSLTDAVAQSTTPQDKAAAQRQLDEYNLQLRATEERRQADQDYAAAVKKIQADRQKAEDEMNRKLAALTGQLENGTGTMADLTAVAAVYGLQITDQMIPDFGNLSTSVTSLKSALDDLAAYIGKITGSTPTVSGGDGGSITDILATPLSKWSQPMVDAFNAAGGDLAGAVLYGGIPSLDVGGEVLQTGLAMVHRGEVFSGVGGRLGGDVILEVDGREIARAAANGLSRDTTAARGAAKAVKPHIDKLVTV